MWVTGDRRRVSDRPAVSPATIGRHGVALRSETRHHTTRWSANRLEHRWRQWDILNRNGDTAKRTAIIKTDAFPLTIMIERLMNKLDDLRSISLSSKSIAARTCSVSMRFVTLFVEKRRQRRVRRASNPPRLVNG